MSTDKTLQISSEKLEDTHQAGELLGKRLKGGETIELKGDVGSGKTAFVRGLAKGAGSPSDVASPTFTISRVYRAHQFDIYHFDFYRLQDPGLMKKDIADIVGKPHAVVVVEWSQVVENVLPASRLKVNIVADDEEKRTITLSTNEEYGYLLG